MSVSIRQIHPVFVGEVSGIDIARPLSRDEVAAIAAGMDRYAVLVFHDQQITDEQQMAFSRNFGPLEDARGGNITKPEDKRLPVGMNDVSNLGKNGRPLDRDARERLFNLGNMLWHSDSSFRPIPAKYSLLSARVVNPVGGNTEFADMRAAYDALDAPTKTLIEDLVCEHSLMYSRGSLGFLDYTEEERAMFRPVRQRLVRTHPVTGRKSLYLSSHAGGIVGMPMPEARVLLRDLNEHATQPRFVYVHAWRPWDFVMWDNRQMMHRVRRYDDTRPRDMRRTTVAGDTPTVAQEDPMDRTVSRRTFIALTGAAAAGTVVPRRASAQQPKKGGTLTIGRNHDADTLYPGKSTGLSAIATNFFLYDGLVLHDFQMKIRPALAERWETSPDGLTWTFHLKKGVKFHCGEPFTARDVKDHFDRWMDTKEAFPTRAKITALEETKVVDDHTVVFKLKNPTLVFLNNISQTEWGYPGIPHAKHVAKHGKDYGVVPDSICGTGPFKLKSWAKDDRMELVRNDDYKWGSPAYENQGPAHVDRIVFRTIPEDAARAAELETGGIDVDIDVAPQHIARLEGKGVKVTSIPRLSSNHLGFNVEKEVFKDARVRKAFAHAVNREQIVQFVMRGQADVSTGFLHPMAPGATPKDEMKKFMADFSLDKAKALLTEAGWKPGAGGVREKDGKPLRVSCFVFTELHERIVTPIQATLREAGADMQIKRLEAAAFTASTRAGDHDMRFLPMIYSSADFMYFFVSQAVPAPNTTRWRDDKTDTLFKVTQTTLKEPERVKAFQQMEQRLVEQAVVVPIQHIRWIFGARPRAGGMKYHPIHGIYKLMDTWVS